MYITEILVFIVVGLAVFSAASATVKFFVKENE